MSFEVTPQAYARFMGRFSVPLAELFADAVGVTAGQRALDVGCGTGALTDVLAARLGVENVVGVDPSESFVTSLRTSRPGLDVRLARAERLPFADNEFDVVLAQLVVHFMQDPVAGIGEMARVARPGGRVGATVWDHAGAGGPLAAFWSAARDLDPDVDDESALPGVAHGALDALFTAAGLTPTASTALSVTVPHASFEDWWEPFTLGVGPAGAHVAAMDAEAREALRRHCQDLLPTGPFTTTARAWTVWADISAG